jgi:dipeptidase E
VRLYLSSFRVGAHPDRLLRLSAGRRVGLISNALDGLSAEVRDTGIRRDFADLGPLGLEVSEIDLRAADSAERLATVDIVWVRGGNVFALRRALADSGTDQVLTDLIQRDAITYGGYSAGACVLAPDLSGLERVDDITAVADPVTTGLGLLDRPFVPHVGSPGHQETGACDALAAWYQSAGQPHWALRDGEVLIVDGDATELLGIAPCQTLS